MMRRCLGCPRLIPAGRSRCASCTSVREHQRGTPAQRGYGAAHQRTRALLASLLPARCGGGLGGAYCGELILPGERWVAAHVLDGDPSAGYVHAHGDCNERAKVRTVVA